MSKITDIHPEWCAEMRANLPDTLPILRDGLLAQAEALGIIMGVVWYDEKEGRTRIVATSDCYDYNNSLMIGMLQQASNAIDCSALEIIFTPEEGNDEHSE
jgi:hypothetical protein